MMTSMQIPSVPPATQASPQTAEMASHEKMGLVQCTSLVVGNMIGSGIFTLPSVLAVYGSISLIGWLATAFGAICLALVHARLAGRYPETGGPYIYAKLAFGRFAAFQTGWTSWVSNGVLGNVSLAIAILSNLTVPFPILAESIPLQLATTIGVLWLLTLINAFGIACGGRFQVILTVIKIIPLFLIGSIGLFYVDWSMIFPLTSGDFSPFQSFTGAMAITLYAFIGLESSTIPAGAVENPQKTIPISTVVGTILTAAVYILTTVVLMGIVPAATLAKSASPFGTAGSMIFGEQAGMIFACLAAVSAMGTLNGMVLLQGQMPYAIAKDGLFPRIFSYLSPRGVPATGLYISSILVTCFLLVGQGKDLVEQFTLLASMTLFCILVPYLITAAADATLLWKEKNEKAASRATKRSLWIAGVAIIYSIISFIGIGGEALLAGIGFLVLSLPVYYFMDYRHKRFLA